MYSSISFLFSTLYSSTYDVFKVLLIAFTITLLLTLLLTGIIQDYSQNEFKESFTPLSEERRLLLITQLNTLLNRNMFNDDIGLEKQEKQKNEELIKKKQEAVKLKYKEKHRQQLNSMYQNYENRVKNFITDMTHPNQMIVMQDNTRIQNSRAALMNECENKKSFVFKGYKTEKDRIADTIRNNVFLFSVDPKEKDKNSKENELKKSMNLEAKKKLLQEEEDDNIIQPEMRFKPRTDLERVFDAINGKYLKENDRQILNRQLQLLDLLTFRRASTNTLNGLISKILPQDQTQNENNSDTNSKANNLKTEPKENPYPRKWMRRMDLNTEAKSILSEYHYKTHFKAAEEVAGRKIVMIDKKQNDDFENTKSPSLPQMTSVKQRNKDQYSTVNTKKRKKDVIFAMSDDDANEYDTNMSYDTYDKNRNPLQLKINDNINASQMCQLSKLAFTKPVEFKDETTELRRKNTRIYRNSKILTRRLTRQKAATVDENIIYIDNEILNKGTQLDLIASKVLNLCNVYHSKSLHNNTTLKKKEGKLMFTNGMSISQFEKKYKF